jgi:hypothetical protein
MAARGGRGFWRGFSVGLVLSAVVAVVLAWAFPPLRAPEVEEGALRPPTGPSQPGVTGRPETATPDGVLPERAGPPAASEPGPDRAP